MDTSTRALSFETPQMSGYTIRISRGGSLPAERHPDATQLFMVLKGVGGRVEYASGTALLSAGTIFYVPPNMEHAVFAGPDEDLFLFTAYAPPHHRTEEAK